jgi:hypothetical protein
MRVLAVRDEQARKEEQAACEAAAKNPFECYGEVVPSKPPISAEKARRDSERACLEQSGIPDHPVVKIACAAQ